MTRAYNENIRCPKCGEIYTAETDMERWMRNDPELDSVHAGVVRFDFIEVKTFNADLSLSQRETLSMFSQVLRNRKRNLHGDRKGCHARDHIAPSLVYSHMYRRWIRLKLFGGHLLQLSNSDPLTSELIRWDGKPIDKETLKGILQFELDPDSPCRVMDWSRRYSSFEGVTPDFDFVKALDSP